MQYFFFMTRTLLHAMFSRLPAAFLYWSAVLIAAGVCFVPHLRPYLRKALPAALSLWICCEILVDLFCAEVFTNYSLQLLVSDIGTCCLLFSLGAAAGLALSYLRFLWRGKHAPAGRARFLIVSKSPHPLSYVTPSAISPQSLDPGKLCQVLLRFDPRREHHHPDDNDLLLTCSPELYARLREGTHGVGVWEKKQLLAFTPEEVK